MRNQAGIFPLQEAWQEYEPVQLPGGMEIALPDRDAIVGAFLLQAEPFGNRENGG
jgi:hypothetical protein